MRDLAIKYKNEGYNCTQCILKAADEKFNLGLTDQMYNMFKCCSNGLGIGTTCNSIEAGMYIFGLMFDDRTCLHLRTKLITLMQGKFHSIYCCKLKKMLNRDEDCQRIIAEIADTIERLINEEMNKALRD